MTMELKEAIKIELSHKGSLESLPVELDIQQLGARVSIKGSNAETNVHPSGEDDVDAIPSMGLYVQHHDRTHLVALRKILQGGSTIHSVAYAYDVVRVSVEKVIDANAEVLYPTSKI